MFILSPLCSEEGHSLLRDPKVSPPPDHYHYYYFQYLSIHHPHHLNYLGNTQTFYDWFRNSNPLFAVFTQKRKKRTLDEKTSNDVSRSPRFARSRETNARIDSPVVVLT